MTDSTEGEVKKKAEKVEKTESDSKKSRALEQAVAQIEKQFGKGTIMQLGGETVMDVPVISTGSLSLDLALGVGGIPRGRVAEIYGPEGGGKTTLALHIIANAQKQDGVGVFIDAEHALDPDYAKRLGVNLDNLLVNQPDSGEQALDVCEMLVRSNAVDIVVIDSVAALVPRAEIEGEMGDQFMGLQARLMSQAMRKLTGVISKSRTSVVFINQIREKIGIMFGNPEVTPGGRALKFYSSVRIEIRRIGSIKDGETTIGSRTRAKVVKNKVAPPFRSAEFDLIYGQGFSKEGDLVDLGLALGLIEKTGSWLSLGETRLGQGRENVKGFLKDNPDIANTLEQEIRKRHAGKGLPISLGEEEAKDES